MSHPLFDRLASLRRRARLLVVMHALAWLTGSVVVAAAVLAAADYLIHFQDRGLRWICSLAVVAIGVWIVARRLWPALAARFDDIYLAQRVEARFPQLQDALASTIQFLRSDVNDPRAGSAELRRSVIAETGLELESLDLREAIDARPTLKVVGCCALLAIAVAGLALADRASSRLAMTRLAMPWSDASWPKSNHLAIAQPPTRLALGQRFEIEVVDQHGAPLPDDVRFVIRYQGDREPEHAEPMRRVGDRLVAGIDHVARPFAYRAVGGDDHTMPWIELEVIEPPAVRELSVMLHYPTYTAWSTAPSDPHIRALVGTRVALEGTTIKPIKSATVHVEPGGSIALMVDQDGYRFTLSADAEQPWVVKKSGSYRIDLEDTEGFHGHQEVRYDLRAVEDRAPSIVLEEPAADTFVTPEAIVPLRLLAKDDLALKQITLHWSRSDRSDEAEQTIVLHAGPETLPEADAPASAAPGESRLITHRFELAPLEPKPGSQLTIFARASDYQPLSTQSHARRLTIVTAAELQDRLAERQQFVINELSRIVKIERDSRGQVSNAEIQLEQVGQLSKSDVDRLQQAELLQRQVERGLTSKTEGLPAHIAGLLADLQNNKLEAGETAHRMRELAQQLKQLADNQLPNISRDLTAALKDVQSRVGDASNPKSTPKETSPPTAAKQTLASAGKQQDEVIQTLEQRLGELSQWDNYRRFHRDISQLRREQEQLRQETAATGAKTLTKDQKDLTPQEAADLKKLGSQQNELSRQFDKIQQRMAEMADKLREADQVASDTLNDALHQAQKNAVGGKLREAGRNVEQNQVGQAAQQQQQALNELDQLLDILANRRENELGRLVKKLREAEQQLDKLRKDQAGLKKKFEENARNTNEQERKRELERLTRQQRELQQEAERFARQLKRLQADQAGRSAERGGAKMGQAGQQGEKGDGQQAAKEAEQALQDLDDAAQQLAQQRRKSEADLAAEQMTRLQDLVKGLSQQQEKLLVETKDYDARQKANGRLTRAEAQSVQDLARQQQSLADDTTGTGEKLTADAFKLALKSAARDMTAASRRLAARDVSAETQRIEQHAAVRLKSLLDALQPDKPDGDKQQKKNDGGKQGGGGEGGGGQQNEGPGLAQLKLLKLMQEDINGRTRDLEQAAGQGEIVTPERQQEYLELSREQGELADLLVRLTTPKPTESNPSDDLDKLLQDPPSEKQPLANDNGLKSREKQAPEIKP